MRAYWLYLAAVSATVLVLGGIGVAVTDSVGRQTVVASGVVTLAVQAAAFAVARAMRTRNLMLGWGLGSVIRLLAVVLYAVVVARLWRAPVTPALLSLAAFLFVSTLVEPVFLRR